MARLKHTDASAAEECTALQLSEALAAENDRRLGLEKKVSGLETEVEGLRKRLEAEKQAVQDFERLQKENQRDWAAERRLGRVSFWTRKTSPKQTSDRRPTDCR